MPMGYGHRPALSPRQIMFSFLKRLTGSKSGSKAPDATPEPQATSPSPLPVDAPQAQAIVTAEASAPVAQDPVVTLDAPDNDSIEPDRESAVARDEPAVAIDETAEFAVEIVPPPAPAPAAKTSWLTRLKTGLSKTSSSLTTIFVGAKIDEDLYEELETALLMSDAGVDATEYLLDSLREKVRTERLTEAVQVKAALRSLLIGLLKPLEKSLMLGRAQPLVMMIAGVNGAGKTTSIGKLAKHLQRFDQSVLLAAGDTFRAAAREQLTIWGERNNVTVVSQESGDPARRDFRRGGRGARTQDRRADGRYRRPSADATASDGRTAQGQARDRQSPDGAPHEVLLVIDANTGQNALAQVKSFDDALGLTGLIVTKLDGTAKGGILAAIARQRPIPVYFIGGGRESRRPAAVQRRGILGRVAGQLSFQHRVAAGAAATRHVRA